MCTLLYLLMTLMSQDNTKFPHPEFVVKSYPETVMLGDTLYFTIVAANPHAESIYIMDHFYLFTNDIQVHLKDSENQMQRLLFEGPPVEADFFLRVEEIKSRESRVIAAASINVPPLEDLKEPFWEKYQKNLSSDTKLTLCVTIMSISASNEAGWNNKRKTFMFETPLVMKSRPEKEMALIRKWYDGTPNELFPVFPYSDRNSTKKIPSGGRSHFPKAENITVKGEKVVQSQFMRSSNRYPGHPNAPETWQGWKELEESLTPSTMRDEIRLARILIQYSDTEDDALLKEIRDWFADMNEVQRSVLVKRTRNKGKMYEAVKEFDTALFEWEKEHLRNLGLVE